MQFESDHKNLAKALEFCLQSVEFYRKGGDLIRIAHATRHLADLQRSLGNTHDADRNYRISLNIYRTNPSTLKGDLANALRGHAILLEETGKISTVIDYWEEIRQLYKECNLKIGVDEAEKKLKLLQ